MGKDRIAITTAAGCQEENSTLAGTMKLFMRLLIGDGLARACTGNPVFALQGGG